jgi:hypothetical protein
MADAPTRLLFPLRTSVELFRDPDSPAAAIRAKQGAVLDDEIAFETGAFEITVTTDGSWQEWRPAQHLSDEELRAARHIHETGASFSLMAAKQPAKGVPAPPDAMRTIIQGGITRHYVAEWESVIRELGPLEPKWASVFPITDDYLRASGLDQEIRRRDFECMSDRLKPGPDSVLRNWIYQAFNRDAVVAESRASTLNATSLFLPVVERAGVEPVMSGEHALQIVAPNLGHVPWDAVCEFRDHTGCREAREKLRSVEQRALADDPADLAEFRLRLGQEMTHDYMLAFDDMKPSLGLDAFRQALTTTVSTFVPPVGPMAGLMETKYRQWEHQRSWRTALMKLSDAR